MAALNVDKAALSRLIAIATRVPAEVIDAIGPAPAFGRVRWQELTDLLEQEANRARALDIVKAPLSTRWTPTNVSRRLPQALRKKSLRARAENWAAKDGTHAAKVSRVGQEAHSDIRRSGRTEVRRLRQTEVADPLRRIQSRRSAGMNLTCPVGMSRLDQDHRNQVGEP